MLIQSYCDTSCRCSAETLTTPIRPVSLSLGCRWDVTHSVAAARVRAAQCLPAHLWRSSAGMLCCFGEVAREAGSDSPIEAEGGRKLSCGRRRTAVGGRGCDAVSRRLQIDGIRPCDLLVDVGATTVTIFLLSFRSPSSTRAAADDTQKDETPQIPPRIRTTHSLEKTLEPAVPIRIVSQPLRESSE